MKKFLTLLQWAVVIALLLFGLRMVIYRPTPPARQPETWTSWTGFHALSFAGITRTPQPGCLTRRQLADHLAALTEAGYQTIYPAEALAFLEGRHPLPDRAVLLLFEGGRKDSFLHATPLLRRHQAVATLFVPTALVQSGRGSFFLKPDELDQVVREPHWRLGSMGHQAINTETESAGQVRRFLSQRLTLGADRESDEAYQARIANDLATASRFLAPFGGTSNSPLLLPYADDGHQPGADPLAATTIADAILMTHPLAFTRSEQSFHGPNQDPRRLSSLRIPAEWDSPRLIQELESMATRTAPVTRVVPLMQWNGQGQITTNGTNLRLEAGARAWLRGTADWTDASVELGLRRSVGASAVLYLRHAGPNRYLRLRASDQGLLLQEKLDTTTQTLYADNLPLPAESTIKLQVKGNRLWLSVGQQLRAGSVPLARITRQGQVGVEAEGGAMDVTSITAQPDVGRLALVQPGYQALPESERARIRTVVVPWFDARRTPSLTLEQHEDLLLAADAGVTYIPRIEHGRDLDAEQAAALVDAISRVLDQDRTRALVTSLAVDYADTALAQALRHRGYHVTRLVEGNQLGKDQTLMKTTEHPDSWVILNMPETLLHETTRWKRLAPDALLAVEVPDHLARPGTVRQVVRF